MLCAECELCPKQDKLPQVSMATLAREDEPGGSTANNARACSTTTRGTPSISSTCGTKAGKCKANAGEGAGMGKSRFPKTKGGSKKNCRKRLDVNQKVEIHKVGANVSHEERAGRFGCSEGLIWKVKAEREKVETRAAAEGSGTKKNIRKGDVLEGNEG